MMADKRIPETFERIGYADPIKRAEEDSRTLAASWLRGGAALTPLQRIGHGLMTLLYLGGGLVLGQEAIAEFDAGDGFSFLQFILPAVFFLTIAGYGFRNILRRKRTSKSD